MCDGEYTETSSIVWSSDEDRGFSHQGSSFSKSCKSLNSDRSAKTPMGPEPTSILKKQTMVKMQAASLFGKSSQAPDDASYNDKMCKSMEFNGSMTSQLSFNSPSPLRKKEQRENVIPLVKVEADGSMNFDALKK